MTSPAELSGIRVTPLDRHPERYEARFSTHENAYEAEIRVLRELAPNSPLGLEVGVGAGRSGSPLGIPFGVDPFLSMVKLAQGRGIEVVLGALRSRPGEHLRLRLLRLVDLFGPPPGEYPKIASATFETSEATP